MTNDKPGHDRSDQENRRLFQEFPIPSFEQWRQAAEKTLKGASFEEKLIKKTYEGIALKPMYRKEDLEGIRHVASFPGAAPYVRGIRALGYQEKGWEVCQELAYSTPEEFNAAARYDLERGQTMLNLILNPALPEDRGNVGLQITSINDLSRAFAGINLEQTPVLIQAGELGSAMYSMLMAYTVQQGADVSKLRGCVGNDPLGSLMRKGTLAISLNKIYDLMARDTLRAIEQTPRLQTILVQGDPYHNAGGSAVQELAFVLAIGVEYVRELQERGLSIEDITPRMLFSFSIGSNFFMEVAKLRAARMLWSQVIDAFGGSKEAQKMHIHARTSAWTKTVYDPYVNMLRGTVEAFAGIIGGAQSLHVSPFDEAIRTPDEFSRRIARNTQVILEKEAHLAKVVDPAGGSWYVESLTDSLAKQAWGLFQQVEGLGGQFKAVQDGFVQTQISEMVEERFANIGRRKDKFVGINMYPNLQEEKLAKCDVNRVIKTAYTEEKRAKANKEEILRDEVQAFGSGVTIKEWVHALRPQAHVPFIQPLSIHRGAERFEALRERAEAYKECNGSYPLVFLANMGPIVQHKARADFATGFFQAGGFAVLSSKGFATVEQAAQAALESGASIVVICSTDETYPELAPLLARQLKQVKPEISLFMAGLPAMEQATQYKEAGVDEFIHLRSNCYDVLFNLQQQKGIGQ